MIQAVSQHAVIPAGTKEEIEIFVVPSDRRQPVVCEACTKLAVFGFRVRGASESEGSRNLEEHVVGDIPQEGGRSEWDQTLEERVLMLACRCAAGG